MSNQVRKNKKPPVPKNKIILSDDNYEKLIKIATIKNMKPNEVISNMLELYSRSNVMTRFRTRKENYTISIKYKRNPKTKYDIHFHISCTKDSFINNISDIVSDLLDLYMKHQGNLFAFRLRENVELEEKNKFRVRINGNADERINILIDSNINFINKNFNPMLKEVLNKVMNYENK